MSIITNSAGLLFKIDADSTGFKREMNAVDASLSSVGSKFSTFAGVATIGAAAIATVGTAAIQGATALFNFTKEAADFGSALYDASVRTGLSAAAISALKVAADGSGSSLEAMSGSVAKFNVLLGQAAQGNEKAVATLKQYGITATETDAALDQAIATIARMTTQDQKAAAAKDLFKDRTAAILPVIDQVGGKFAEFTEKARKLGIVLSEEDLKAADDFGDTLGVLGTQAKIAGVKFATEMMPMITGAMSSISKFMSDNQGVAREWGQVVVTTVRGVGVAFDGLKFIGTAALDALTLGMWRMLGNAAKWGVSMQDIILSVVTPLYGLGKLFGQQEVGGPLIITDQSLNAPKMPSIPKMSGGGKGGGGGKSVEDTAEQERKKAVQAAMDTMRDKLAIYKSTSDEAVAILDEQLSRNAISEFAHLKEIRRAKELEAKYEAQLLAQFARNPNLNDDERAEAELKRDIARREARIEELKTQTLINKEFNKANNELFKKIEQQEEFVRLAREELEIARKRTQENAAERRLRNYEYDQQLKEKLDREKSETGFGAGLGSGLGASSITTNVTDPITGVTSAVTSASNAFTVFGQIAGGAIRAVADGIGSMVQAWVLYGSAGPNAMRKMVASVLAGVAAQSAVLAVFELAKGFASLFFNPAEAAAHFKAAALFGSIAVATGLSGRAVAGDAFNQQAGGSSSGGTGDGAAGQPERLNFTERFEGFLQRSNDQVANMLQRTNEVLGGVAESVDTFNQKFGIASPTDVVMAGAGGAGEALFGSVNDYIGSDLRASTDFKRNGGEYN